MSWKNDVKHRFSPEQDASKWDDMYNSDTEKLDDAFFRQRRDWTINYITQKYETDAAICDIGCGAGPITYELLKRGYSPIGLDFSSDMLSNAKKRIESLDLHSIPLINGNSELLPFPDQQFDCIVCLGVISYVEHYENIISEIHRILKPGGTTIITYRNKNNLIMNDPIRIIKAISGSNKEPENNKFIIGRYMSYSEVLRTAENTGLHLIEFTGMGYGPYQYKYKKLFSDKTSINIDKNVSKFMNYLHAKPFIKLSTDIHIMIYKK